MRTVGREEGTRLNKGGEANGEEQEEPQNDTARIRKGYSKNRAISVNRLE